MLRAISAGRWLRGKQALVGLVGQLRSAWRPLHSHLVQQQFIATSSIVSQVENTVTKEAENALDVSSVFQRFLAGEHSLQSMRAELIHSRRALPHTIDDAVADLVGNPGFQSLTWDTIQGMVGLFLELGYEQGAISLLDQVALQPAGSFSLQGQTPIDATPEYRMARAIATAQRDADATLLTLDDLGVLPPFWRSYVKPSVAADTQETSRSNVPFAGEAISKCIVAKIANGDDAEALALFNVAAVEKYKLSREAFPPLFDILKKRVHEDMSAVTSNKRGSPQTPISREVHDTLLDVWQAAVRWDGLYRYHHADKITKTLSTLPPSLLEQLIAAVEPVSPDLQLRAFNVLLNTFGKMSHFRGASRVWRQMRHRSLTPDAAACNSWMAALIRTKKYNEALAIFDLMLVEELEPDAHTLTNVIGACGRLGDYDRAHRYWRVMTGGLGAVKHAIMPDLTSYNALIQAAAAAGKRSAAFDVVDRMRLQGISPDETTYVGLISACIKSDSINMAFSVLDDMMASGLLPDNRVFTSLFRGTAAYKREDLALEALERLLETKASLETGALYNALLTASRTKSLELLRAILNTVDELETPLSPRQMYLAASILVNAGGSEVEMRQMLSRLASSSQEVHSASIGAATILLLVRLGETDEAFDLYQAMRKKRIKMNSLVFTPLIAACATPEKYDRIRKLISEMRAAGLSPNLHTYAAWTEAATKVNNLEEAVELASKAVDEGVRLDAPLFNVIFEATVQENRPDLGELVLDIMSRARVRPNGKTIEILKAASTRELIERQRAGDPVLANVDLSDSARTWMEQQMRDPSVGGAMKTVSGSEVIIRSKGAWEDSDDEDMMVYELGGGGDDDADVQRPQEVTPALTSEDMDALEELASDVPNNGHSGPSESLLNDTSLKDTYDIEYAINREMKQVRLPLDDDGSGDEGGSDSEADEEDSPLWHRSEPSTVPPQPRTSASGKLSMFGAGIADVEGEDAEGEKPQRLNLRTHRRVRALDMSAWSGYGGVEPVEKLLKLSAQDLKKLCGAHGYPISGNKMDMIRRLGDAVYGRLSTLSQTQLLAEAKGLGWEQEGGSKDELRKFLLEQKWIPKDLKE